MPSALLTKFEERVGGETLAVTLKALVCTMAKNPPITVVLAFSVALPLALPPPMASAWDCACSSPRDCFAWRRH
jgi:hypothetical protein